MKDKFNLVGTSIGDFAELPNTHGELDTIGKHKGKKHVVIVLLRDKH